MTQPGSIIQPRPAWFPRTQRVGVTESTYGWITTKVEGTSAAVNAVLAKVTVSATGMHYQMGGTIDAAAKKTTASLAGTAYSGQPVAYSNSTYNNGATVTIPAHEVGDLLVMFVYRGNSTTLPSKPAASGTVPAWEDIDANTGANTNCARTAYFVATATDHTSGTWTGASDMIVVVVKNQNATPIGGHAESGAARTTGSIAPGATLTNPDGTSLLLYFHARDGGDWNNWNAAPSGYTRRKTGIGTYGVVLNTRNVTTTAPSATQETDGTVSVGYRGSTIEILD